MLTAPSIVPPPSDDAPAGDAAAQLLAEWNRNSPAILRTAVLLATRGDMAALRLILERIAPLPRGRTLSMENVPVLTTLADIPRVHAHFVQLVACGTITPEEASAMSAILQNYVDATCALEHEARLAAIEKSLAESNG